MALCVACYVLNFFVCTSTALLIAALCWKTIRIFD